MIKVNLVTMNGKESVFTSETNTLRQVLEDKRVNYATGVIQLDGCSLRPGDLDKSFADHGVTEMCYLSVVVKADNAATVTVIGEAAVITSGLKLDDIKAAEKYRPKALELCDDEGEPYFAIGTSEDTPGAIGQYGATFSETTDADGKATITMNITRGENVKKKLLDKIGGALLNLNKIEEGFGAVIEEINADKAKIEAMIEVK